MIELWYEALGSEHGIIIETTDPKRCQARLYAVRRERGDLDLNQISIIVPATPGQLWLVRMPDAPTEGK